MQSSFTAIEFFFTAAAAIIVSVGLQTWRVSRVLPAAVLQAKPQTDVATWIPRSLQMWLSAMLDTANQYLEVIVIGFFLGPAVAALYFVATRITNVFSMIAASMTGYATSRISGLYHTGARNELQQILRSLAVIGAMLAGGAFLVIVFGGKLLLWSFGEVYVSSYPALIVLAAGSVFSALTGPAAYLLLLTGNEGAYPRIMAAGLCKRVLPFPRRRPRRAGEWGGRRGNISGEGGARPLGWGPFAFFFDPSVAGAVWRMLQPAIRPTGSVP